MHAARGSAIARLQQAAAAADKAGGAGVMLSVWEGQAAGTASAIFLCITGTVRTSHSLHATLLGRAGSPRARICCKGACCTAGLPRGSAPHVLRALPVSQVSNAAMMSMTGRILSEKIDVLRLTFYTAPVSCALLLPVFFIREVGCPARMQLLPGARPLSFWLPSTR